MIPYRYKVGNMASLALLAEAVMFSTQFPGLRVRLANSIGALLIRMYALYVYIICMYMYTKVECLWSIRGVRDFGSGYVDVQRRWRKSETPVRL